MACPASQKVTMPTPSAITAVAASLTLIRRGSFMV